MARPTRITSRPGFFGDFGNSPHTRQFDANEVTGHPVRRILDEFVKASCNIGLAGGLTPSRHGVVESQMRPRNTLFANLFQAIIHVHRLSNYRRLSDRSSVTLWEGPVRRRKCGLPKHFGSGMEWENRQPISRSNGPKNSNVSRLVMCLIWEFFSGHGAHQLWLPACFAVKGRCILQVRQNTFPQVHKPTVVVFMGMGQNYLRGRVFLGFQKRISGKDQGSTPGWWFSLANPSQNLQTDPGFFLFNRVRSHTCPESLPRFSPTPPVAGIRIGFVRSLAVLLAADLTCWQI